MLKGDKIVAFDGHWYEGRNQWLRTIEGGSDALRPGDVLSLSTLREDGSVHLFRITLIEKPRLSGSQIFANIAVQLVPPFICLLIGYLGSLCAAARLERLASAHHFDATGSDLHPARMVAGGVAGFSRIVVHHLPVTRPALPSAVRCLLSRAVAIGCALSFPQVARHCADLHWLPVSDLCPGDAEFLCQ